MAMAQKHKWFGELLLRSPKPIRNLRNIPALGGLIHYLSHRILPADERVCAQIQGGPAKGIHLELNPRTGEMYFRGVVEIATQKVLVERLRPGMIFYDLGANVGFFSLLAARLVGAAGQVFSFEPDPEVAARLRRNVSLNEASTITVVEAGVWSANANVRFIRSDASSPDRGTGRFVLGENQADGASTRCVALDDFIQSAPPPNAIKCDVEGAELEALRGAKQLLETHHPWIMCEMHSDANDRTAREFLDNLGYKIETVDANHILATPATGN
jgi:FkbM family methyltransferase